MFHGRVMGRGMNKPRGKMTASEVETLLQSLERKLDRVGISHEITKRFDGLLSPHSLWRLCWRSSRRRREAIPATPSGVMRPAPVSCWA